MFPFLTEWQGAALKLGMLAAEAQSVVAYRVLGFAGVWSVPPSEAMRMTTEKVPAFLQGWWQAQQAMTSGAPLPVVVTAWASPLEQAAHRNRKRLGRRGPARLPRM